VVDVLTPEQRRHNMSRIRGRDTKPEMLLRRGLHAAGLRFRLHARDLPGRPDIVFPRFRAVVLVHGCFWHGHGCPMCRLPATRADFWASKIDGNRARDRRTEEALVQSGWRVIVVWECSLRGPARQPLGEILARCAEFIRAGGSCAELAGFWDPAATAAQPSGSLNQGDRLVETRYSF
jgi:DNA mismatch endonuclease (patch repair protein)